jgi:cytochrome c biogenesis protein CcmG, thiol:disulfide interchange protein DsbE
MRRAFVLAGVTTLVLVALVVARSGDRGGLTEISEPLPRLSGESVVDRAPLSSDDYAGEVLVINAWATWCAPCKQEQPALIRVFERYREGGVSFLGIDHLDDRASATSWIEDGFAVPYPSLFDPAGAFAATLGYPGLPATFVVDAEGMIRYRRFGPITERMLTAMLDRVLSA